MAHLPMKPSVVRVLKYSRKTRIFGIPIGDIWTVSITSKDEFHVGVAQQTPSYEFDSTQHDSRDRCSKFSSINRFFLLRSACPE